MDWLDDCLIKPNNFTLQLYLTVWHVCMGSWFELSNPQPVVTALGLLLFKSHLKTSRTKFPCKCLLFLLVGSGIWIHHTAPEGFSWFAWLSSSHCYLGRSANFSKETHRAHLLQGFSHSNTSSSNTYEPLGAMHSPTVLHCLWRIILVFPQI